MGRRSQIRLAAAGIASVIVAAGAGELTAALVVPKSSPFAVVGAAAIDAAPSWAKDAAIAIFGTADKLALFVGMSLVIVIIAAIAGILEGHRRPAGRLIIGVLGVVGIVVAVGRPGAEGMAWLPSLIAGTAGVLVMGWMVAAAKRANEADELLALAEPGASIAGSESVTTAPRRNFLIGSAVSVGVGVVALAVGSVVRAGSKAASVVREQLTLPKPEMPAAAVPAGAELDVPGITPLITPTDEYYRIDTALIVPKVDPAEWSLRIHGMVDREVTLTWDDIVALPMQETAVTLACVSNPVGGDLIGNAEWLGFPIRELLDMAGVHEDADMVLSRSVDGFTAGTPIEALTDSRDALLAIGMNGEPLPEEHGFPARLVVPGLYGYVSATKWVSELKVTRFDQDQGYWTPRGWSALGPIKLQSRIDVPRRGAQVQAGETVIAGVAWQQHTGVKGVEVQVDNGPWQKAELAQAISDDTWVQWRVAWKATTGQHTIRARATSKQGETQTSDLAAVVPDGATGWHTIDVNVP